MSSAFDGGENLGPGQGQGNGEHGGDDAQGHIVHGRGGQGQTDEQGAQGVAGIAEHGVKGRPEALGNEHDQDVGEDEQGVEDRKEVDVRQPGQAVVKIGQTENDKDCEKQEGDAFFGRDKAKQVVGQAHVLLFDRLDAVVDAEQDENDQCAETIAQNVQNRSQFGHGDGLGKIGQLFEGVAQQDQGQDFKLFAHGARKRAGQGEDQADHFQDQDQGKGQIDGVKMVGRGVCGQGGRQQTLPVQLDDGHGPQKNQDQPQGQPPVHAFVFPEMMQRVENKGQAFKKSVHGQSLLGGRSS